VRAVPFGVFIAATAALGLACGGGSSPEPEATATPAATSTPRAIPSPAAVPQVPGAGFSLGDAYFEALPEATAHFGQLGGSLYQIEMPNEWNGTLVLYLHGSRDQFPTLYVDQPSIRSYLIRNGYAWGASSFSRNDAAIYLGADETAAVWDRFVEQFGRPERTYVTGQSMGGGGTVLSAERFPDRFDGALPLCAIAGTVTLVDYFGDAFVAGAYVAGVTQSDFEATAALELVQNRILPKLSDPVEHQRWLDMVIALTGGPRPFAREGLLLEEDWLWTTRYGAPLAGGFIENRERVYTLGPPSDVASEAFNAAAVRIAHGESREVFGQFIETTGNIQVPVLTMHTTGDFNVPINHERFLRERVAAAGRTALLVQRAVQAPGHCTFTNAEWQRSLEDLIAWVEDGKKPEGEDLSGDLTNAGAAFTLAPRFGSQDAEDVPGADERLTLSGTIMLDGQPVTAEVYIVVVKDGLRRYCGLSRVKSAANGRYEVAVASDAEARGCGHPGAQLYVDAYVPSRGRSFWSQELADWPASGNELAFDAALGDPGAYRPTTLFRGEVVDRSGESLPMGTVIEAYIGDMLCGITSLPPAVMALGDPATYYLAVVGPESVGGCEAGGTVTFRVAGKRVEQDGVNDYDGRFYGRHLLDLVVD